MDNQLKSFNKPLTKGEIARCNLFNTEFKYIARDANGELFLYENKPKKLSVVFDSKWPDSVVSLRYLNSSKLFDNVKWEDDEATPLFVCQGKLILSELDIPSMYPKNWRENSNEIKRKLDQGRDVIIYNPLYLYTVELPFEDGKFKVYIQRASGTKNIHDLTDKDIRRAHNIFRMYIAGSFDED